MVDYHPPSIGAMPTGSKLWILNLGYLDCDESNHLAGANSMSPSAPAQKHTRRHCVMICILIYYPSVGLVLYDTESPEDLIKHWDSADMECTPRIWNKAENGLPEAIAATGNKIQDVKLIIISDLHMDHCAGLEHFPRTGISRVLHRPHYLTVHDLNWKTFSTPSWPLLPGITLHRCPGHTDGSIVAEFQLENEGTVVATSDLFHVKEDFEHGRPQGTLITDFTSWHRSRWYVKNLVERRRAKVILGHDKGYFETFKSSPVYQASGYAS